MRPDLPNPLRPFFNPRGYDFLASQPAESNGYPQRRWPLILFLHGAAERGADLRNVMRYGLPRLISGESDLSPAEIEIAHAVATRFVVVAPQCGAYEVWHEEEVLRLLDEAGRRFKIDPTRVYLTGLSMGGFGVWSTGLRTPERFAALIPICGGGRIKDVTTTAARDPAALRTLGIWAFHGTRDRIVPVEESARMIDAVKQAGVADVRFTVYEEGEHDAWTASYANPELYGWMLQHAR